MDATAIRQTQTTGTPIDPETGKFMSKARVAELEAQAEALAAKKQAEYEDLYPPAKEQSSDMTDMAPAYIDPLRVGASVLTMPAPIVDMSPFPAPPKAADGNPYADVSRKNPFRVWTAGPNMPREKIFMPGYAAGLRPATDGAYYLTSPEQVIHIKRALGAQFWPDDIPEGTPDAKCETCGWKTRSYAAITKHLNVAHGRPQSG